MRNNNLDLFTVLQHIASEHKCTKCSSKLQVVYVLHLKSVFIGITKKTVVLSHRVYN